MKRFLSLILALVIVSLPALSMDVHAEDQVGGSVPSNTLVYKPTDVPYTLNGNYSAIAGSTAVPISSQTDISRISGFSGGFPTVTAALTYSGQKGSFWSREASDCILNGYDNRTSTTLPSPYLFMITTAPVSILESEMKAGNNISKYIYAIQVFTGSRPVIPIKEDGDYYIVASWMKISTSSTTCSHGCGQTHTIYTSSATPQLSQSAKFTITGVQSQNEAPVITDTVVPTAWGATSSITVTATDDKEVSALQYALTQTSVAPDAGWQTSPTFAISQNANNYYAHVKDAEGEITTSGPITVSNIDTSPPSILGHTITPDSWSNSNITVTINAVDSESGIDSQTGYSFDGGVTWGARQRAFTSTTTLNTSAIKVRNQAGQISTYGQSVVIDRFDKERPEVTDITYNPVWGSRTHVTIVATDNVEGPLRYAVSQTYATPPDSEFKDDKSAMIDSNGNYFAFAKDSAGNVSYVREFTITNIDTIKPRVTSVSHSSISVKEFTAEVIGSDEGDSQTNSASGIASYSLVKKGNASSFTASNKFKITDNGAYDVQVKDNRGNVSDIYTYNVTCIDKAPPILKPIVIPDTWGNSVTVSAESDDTDIAGYYFSAIRTQPSPDSEDWSASPSRTFDTTNTYYVWAKDNVGNISAPVSFTISKIDRSPPTAPRITQTPEVTTVTNESVKIVLASQDIGGSLLTHYGVSYTSNPDTVSWQVSPTFMIDQRGAYYFWAKDGAGNVSPHTYRYIENIDGTPPLVESVPYNRTPINTSINVSITAYDDSKIASIMVRQGTDSEYRRNSSKVFTANTNGRVEWLVTDEAGNTATLVQDIDFIDKIPPTFTVTGGKSDAPDTSKGAPLTITINATDTQDTGYGTDTTLLYSFNGSDYSGTKTYTVTQNGTYTIKVKDAAGNVVTQSYLVNRYDQDAPDITHVNYPNQWGQSVTVSVVATDTSTPITYRLNGLGAWQTSSDFVIDSSGEHKVEAKDAFGNIATKTFTVTKVDRKVPYFTNQADLVTDIVSNNTINWDLRVADGESGIKEVRAKFDSYTAGNTQFEIVAQSVGAPFISLTQEFKGTCYFEVEDNAGNITSTNRFEVILDKTPPAQYTPSPSPTNWYKAPFSFTIGTPADQNSVTATLNNEPITLPYTVTVENTGIHEFNLRTQDIAGNSTISAFSYKVDASPPSIYFTPSVSTWTKDSYTYTYRATDAESGIGNDAVFPVNVVAEAAGTGSSIVTVRDKVGNVATVTLNHNWLDTEPPIISNVTHSNSYAKELVLNIEATDSKSGIRGYSTSISGPFTNTIIVDDNIAYDIFAQDRAGNVSAPYTFNVSNIDKTPPRIDNVVVDTNITASASFRINATDEHGEAMKYSVLPSAAGTPTLWQDTSEFAFDNNGTYYAYAKDKLGNISAAYEVQVSHVDKTNPVLTLSLSTEEVTRGNVTLTATGTDVNPLVYSFDSGATFSAITTKTYFARTVINPGTIMVKDTAGNITTNTEQVLINIDREPPTISAVTYSTDWSKQVYAEVAAVDNLVGALTYAFNTTENTPSASAFSSSRNKMITANGDYYAFAMDAAGNISQGKYFRVRSVDDVNPNVLTVSSSEKPVKEFIATIEGTDPGDPITYSASGIASYALVEEGGTPIFTTSNKRLITKNGKYDVYVQDKLYNTSQKFVYEVSYIDRVAPIINSVDVNTDVTASVELSVNATDERDEPMEYAILFNKPGNPAEWQTSDELTAQGNGTYYIYAKDDLDNISDYFKVVVTHVDKNAPTLVVSVSHTGTTNKNVTVTLEATDENSIQYSFDAGTTYGISNEKIYREATIIAIGDLVVKDTAGNTTSNTEDIIIDIDRSPPQITGIEVIETNGKYKLTIETDKTGVLYSYDGGVTWTSENPYYSTTKIDPSKILMKDEAGNITRVNNTEVWKDENILEASGNIIVEPDISTNADGSYTLTLKLKEGESYASYVYSFDGGRTYSDKYSIKVPKGRTISGDMIKIKSKVSEREIDIPNGITDEIVSITTPILKDFEWDYLPDGSTEFTFTLRDDLDPDDYEFSFDGGKTFGPSNVLKLKPGEEAPDAKDVLIRRKDGGEANTQNLEDLFYDAIAKSTPLDQDKAIRYELDQVTGKITILPANVNNNVYYSDDGGKTWKPLKELPFDSIEEFLKANIMLKDGTGKTTVVDVEDIKDSLTENVINNSVVTVDNSKLVKDKPSTVQVELSPDLNTSTFDQWKFELDGKPIPSNAVRLVGSTLVLSVTPTSLNPTLTISNFSPALPDAVMEVELSATPSPTSTTQAATQQPTTSQPATTQQSTTQQPVQRYYNPTDIYQPYNDSNANVTTTRPKSETNDKTTEKDNSDNKTDDKFIIQNNIQPIVISDNKNEGTTAEESTAPIVPQMITMDEAIAKGYITEEIPEAKVPSVTPTYIVENLTIEEDDVSPSVFNSLKERALVGLDLGHTVVDRVISNVVKDITFDSADENVEVLVDEFAEFAEVDTTTVIHGIEDIKQRIAGAFAIVVIAGASISVISVSIVLLKRYILRRKA